MSDQSGDPDKQLNCRPRPWIIHISLEGIQMLKKRTFDFVEQQKLFELMVHPEVLPFVRHKATTIEEYIYMNAQLIEAENRGELMSRIILNQEEQPIGTINLFDMANERGFLGTWLGKEFQGKGYNQLAKLQFLTEVFTTSDVSSVLMSIRKINIGSQKAAAKLPYVTIASDQSRRIFEAINPASDQFELFEIGQSNFFDYVVMKQEQMNVQQIV